MNDKYTKITYQTDPIGENKIILYLTTFDLEAFEKDKELEKIPTKRIAKIFSYEDYELNKPNLIYEANEKIREYVDEVYKKQLEEMKSYIEGTRKMNNNSIFKVQEYSLDKENK